MAASDETCEGNPNFAIICSFITKFGEECGVNVSIPYLQQMLEDTKNVHQDLLEIILLLMRRGKKRVNKDKWEKSLVKFCHEYSSVDAWEIERFGFIKSKLSVKLELFKRLLELQFDANAKFKGEVNKLDATSLRILPIGKDIDGHAYWYQLDKDYNMRIYRESFNEEDNCWQLLCSTTDDLKNLIESLEKKYSSPGTCKDDSGDLKDPKSPPPEMPLPKIEKDSEGMTSHLSETKPCTIIIKTEKRESVSHTETSIKTESSAKADSTNKKPDDSGSETKNKESESMDTSQSSEKEQKPDKSTLALSATTVTCDRLDSKDLSEKSAINASDSEPMDVETIKLTEKDPKICDIEMENVEDVSSGTISEKLNEEHLDQNTSAKSKSPVAAEQMDSVNHHKSSKIKLYEKWSNEKKKLENVKAHNLETDKTPKKLENFESEAKLIESDKPLENLETSEGSTGQLNKTSEPLKPSKESIVKSNKCSEKLEEKNISVSESSKSSKDGIDKTEHSNSTVEKKNDSSTHIEKSPKQSKNQAPDLEKSDKGSDSEQMAVDLSKTSRVNVIVQNTSSKPSLSNGAKSDSRKSENLCTKNTNSDSLDVAKKSDSRKSENLCTKNTNSDSLDVAKKRESAILSMKKPQEAAMDLKCSPYSVDSDKMYKSNPTFSQSYDVSVIKNAGSNSGLSHLQALQNMCESNAMGGIPSIIHSTNQCKSETNKTAIRENNLSRSTDYEDLSRKYNFNDVHCFSDKMGSNNHDASNVLLKSNVHESKNSEEIKNDKSLSKSSMSNHDVSKNDRNETGKPQLFPTDLSCTAVIKSSDNEPKVLSNVCTVKRKSSEKEQPDPSKKMVESNKETSKSSKENCSLQTDDTVKLDSSVINDLSQNRDAKEKKDPKTLKEKSISNSFTEECAKNIKKHSEINDCATDLSVSQCLQTKLSHTDKHITVCEQVNKSSDNSKSVSEIVSLPANSCDTPSKNVKDSLCVKKESNIIVSVSESKQASETSDEVIPSESKKASETSEEVIPPESKKASETSDEVIPSESENSLHAEKGSDLVVSHSESKEASKTSDELRESESKEASKTSDELSESESKEASKTSNELPESESKEASKTSDELSESESKEASKTSNELPESESKEASKTSDELSESESKEASKTSNELPESESKEASKASDRVLQSKSKEANKTSGKVSQSASNETNESSDKDLESESKAKNKISIDSKENFNIGDSSLIKSAAVVKKSGIVSSESKESKDECPHLRKPDESDSDSKGSEAEPPHLKEPSKLKSDLNQKDIDPPDLKVCSKSNAELKLPDSQPKSPTINLKCGESKAKPTVTKKPTSNIELESKSSESSVLEENSNSASFSKECEMPSSLNHQKKLHSPLLEKSNEVSSEVHEIKNTDAEITDDPAADKTEPKNAKSVECAKQSQKTGEVEAKTVGEKEKELTKNESAKSPESNDRTEKESKVDVSTEKDVSAKQILSSNKDRDSKKSDTVKDKNIDDCSTSLSEKEDLMSKSNLEKSEKIKKSKECVQNDASKQDEENSNNLEVNEKSESSCVDEEGLTLKKSVCDDTSDANVKNAGTENDCKKQISTGAKVDSQDSSDIKVDSQDSSDVKVDSQDSNDVKVDLQDSAEKDKSIKVKDSEKDCSSINKTLNSENLSSKIQSVDNENNTEKKEEKIIISENESIIDKKAKKIQEASEKVTPEIADTVEPEDSSKKNDELNDSVKEAGTENDTKVVAAVKSKPKGRPRKKTSARRSRRGGRNVVIEEIDLETNCLPADNTKELLNQDEEKSGVSKSSESVKVKQISKKESVAETTVIENNTTSEATYKLKFKIYDLQLNSCLETKFKHPLFDKYIRCYKSQSSLDQPKEKQSPAKASPKKAPKQPAVNKKPPTPPKPTPPKPPPPKKPPTNSAKKPGRNRKGEKDTKENFAIPEGFLEILDKASNKGPPGKKRRTSDIMEVVSSHNSSENESTPRKRSRRIQEQHQKKITELAVEMEREQRMLEQMAKRSNSSKKNKNAAPKPVEKLNVKSVTVKTPTKSSNTPTKNSITPTKSNNTPTKSRGRGKLVPPVIVEDVSLDSKRTTRKMNSRAKHLTKVQLLYEDESKDSQCSTSRETESKSRRRRRRHGKKKGGFKPWDVSSESSSSTSIEEITDEEEEEPDEPLIFEVNEDEFACEEVDPTAEPVIVKRARTAKKTEVEDTEECINDDTPCQKCGKYDKPEWILLCDKCDKGYHTHCLIPPLMIVPDGDWFCQPCEHMSLCQCLHAELNKLEAILKQKEREALRKQRLAYVGISLDNVLKPEKKEKSDESSKEDKEEEEEEKEEKKVKVESESRRNVKSKRTEEEERNEILYGKRSVRARRKVNYQFKEYDELIFSALQEDMLEVPEEFKAEAGSDAGSNAGSDKPFTAKVSTRKKRARRFKDFDSTDEDSEDDYQGGSRSSDSEATAPPSDNSEAPSDGSEDWRVVKSSSKKKTTQRRTQTRRRRRRRGGSSSEEDWEDEVVDEEPYRPTTRRAAQKAVSYREISSEEEDEWGSKPKVNKRPRKSSSSGSEASIKKKPSKKKRVRKWGSSESSEESEEKSMSSSGESEEESAEEQSEDDWRIVKTDNQKKTEKKVKKKVLSSEDEEEEDDDDNEEEEEEDESSRKKSAPKIKTKRVVSESEEEEEEEDDDEEESESEEEEEEEEEDDDDQDQEEKQKIVKPTKNHNVEDKDKNKNTTLEKEVNSSTAVPEKEEESHSISENINLQPKVLIKKELCSVDIPLEPMKPPSPQVTPLVDKELPPKPARKEVTKVVPSIIPYETCPPKSGQVPADDVIKNDIRKKDEMSYIPPPNRSPMHLSKQSANIIPSTSGDRIQYGVVLPRHTVPPGRHSANVRPQMPAPTNLSVRPPPSSVVIQHPSRLPPRPRSGVPMPPKSSSIPSPLTQTVPATKSDNKPFKSTIMEPFSSIDDENDSDDEVPLERIPTASSTAPRPVSYERETEYRPAAKELSSYSYAPPEDKPFPGSYSNLSSFPRPSPLKPSLVETYPNNSSPSKLTPLDTYSQSNSPKGFISLDSYSENKKKKHFYGSSTSQEGEPPRFPPEPYPCPQSPSSSYPHRSPPTNQRDPGTPPRLYSQFPDAYAPPRSPEYYQNHQYYASEERIPRPSYQPNYAPQEPPSFVSNPYVATPVPQPNGGFMIDSLLQGRSHENEEDALTGVTDIVQYITQE